MIFAFIRAPQVSGFKFEVSSLEFFKSRQVEKNGRVLTGTNQLKFWEHSRPGYYSARPRAEHERREARQTVRGSRA
jgi:hypothetical protein